MSSNYLSNLEYGPYYKHYIDLAGNEILSNGLEKSRSEFIKFIEGIEEEKMHTGYAEGKWSIKELILHLIDAERVFQYRALRILRHDRTDLPGFEHNDYVPVSKANNRSKESLLEEYRAVRESSLKLFSAATEEDLAFVGSANGSPVSARALGYIIIGHERHHAGIISERYL